MELKKSSKRDKIKLPQQFTFYYNRKHTIGIVAISLRKLNSCKCKLINSLL